VPKSYEKGLNIMNWMNSWYRVPVITQKENDPGEKSKQGFGSSRSGHFGTPAPYVQASGS
jgi:hypothetical protein